MRKLKLEELGRDNIESFKAKSKLPVVVILDNVRSGHNVGSVFRTCDAFALEQVMLCGITPQPPHKEINKTAIGASRSVDWAYHKDVCEIVMQLKEKGYTIYGVEQTTASLPLNKVKIHHDKPIALIFGNEVNGISESVLPLLDQAIEIEQYGTKHSLNIAVCAGIVIWEVSKDMR